MYSLKFEAGEKDEKEKKPENENENEEWDEKEEDKQKEIEEVKTAKGIVKSVIKNEIKHEMYKNILEKGERMHSEMTVIRSSRHQLYTTVMNKVSLSAYDDKRYIHDDGIRSYAYGHYLILN